MPDKPHSFQEVAAAQDPADRARLVNAASFNDVTVRNPFHQQVAGAASTAHTFPRNCQIFFWSTESGETFHLIGTSQSPVGGWF
jgi:hypothetical protein